MADKEQIDNLVAMLDNFVTSGGGHMNIQVDNPENLDQINVETFKSSDCGTGNSACKVPTLHQGLEEEE